MDCFWLKSGIAWYNSPLTYKNIAHFTFVSTIGSCRSMIRSWICSFIQISINFIPISIDFYWFSLIFHGLTSLPHANPRIDKGGACRSYMKKVIFWWIKFWWKWVVIWYHVPEFMWNCRWLPDSWHCRAKGKVPTLWSMFLHESMTVFENR